MYVFSTHGNGVLGEGEDVIELAQAKVGGCDVGYDGRQNGVRRRLRLQELIARRSGGRREFPEEIDLIAYPDAQLRGELRRGRSRRLVTGGCIVGRCEHSVDEDRLIGGGDSEIGFSLQNRRVGDLDVEVLYQGAFD